MPVLERPHLRREKFRIDRILRPEPERLPRRQKKVVAVMPAYNAEQTLTATLADIPAGSVDEVILVDDGSKDGTLMLSR